MTCEPEALQVAEWEAWSAHVLRSFGAEEPSEEREVMRELSRWERGLVVRDGPEIVGTAASLPFRMTVPGGSRVRAAGVTSVSTAPTHRRRGILRSLMRRQLDDLHEAGEEPVAVLTATQPAIYGRFGYGMASCKVDARLEADGVRLQLPPSAEKVRLRLVDEPALVSEECEEVYAACVPRRAGMLERLPGWENLALLDTAEQRQGATALACVLAESEGRTTGYARYRLKRGADERGVHRGTVVVRDLMALDPGSAGALWQYLLDLDLMSTVRTGSLPVDDPLLEMADDLRRCSPALRDDLFCRPVEVGRALASRSYAQGVDVVLAVEDAFCPWNSGRWRLSGDESGAACEPTRDAAELSLTVRELGAAYLGGTSLFSLERAGRVEEIRPGALRVASAAFRTEPAPWVPHGF